MERLIRHFNSCPPDPPSSTHSALNGLSNSSSGCFGVRLDELCARDNANVPLVMIQMCAFLRAIGGLHTKGVFRVNGNSRIIESLRKAADSSTSNEGDESFLSHLERYGNIHSVASLIKLFIRELPVGLVPPAHTKELLENYTPNTDDSLVIIDRVVRSLPPPNYRLLEHLCCFLRQVTQYYDYNQMDSKSIGIVFGPNVFRCPRDSEGLASQNVINEIMSILVERSDVLFARQSTPDVPSATRNRHNGDSLSLSPTSTPDETESGIESHHRPNDNHHHLLRHQRSYTPHSPYYVEPDLPRNTFFQDDAIHMGENERHMTPSPTDTDSQSVMNFASDVAEQLSATLQACLRTCVRQHAVPSPQPTTMPSSSSRQQHYPIRNQHHGPSPMYPITSHSNSPAVTTSVNQWFGGDFNSVSAASSLLSPPRASSQPFNSTFNPLSELRSHSPISRLNEENNHNRMRPQGSPLLQIPPPPPLQSVSAWEESNQMRGEWLRNRAPDIPSETPLRQSSSNSQHADVILFIPRRTSEFSLQPIGNSSAGETERNVERWSNRDNGYKDTHPAESKGSPQFRCPIQVYQGTNKSGNLEDAYNDLVQKLVEKRTAANRPERLIDMTFAELEAEKLLMQRLLLTFESTYGRPTERNDRILMRPVYDRYRCVKRLLAAGASQNCGSNPFTPAHIFVPPDVLESVESLSPLQVRTPNSAIKTTSRHSDVYVSIVGSSLRDSATSRDELSVPVKSQHIPSSHKSFDYPLIPSSSVTSRCTSVNLSANQKSSPEEWFGSLGVSRTSGQRMRYPLRHFDSEERDIAKTGLGQSVHETVVMVNQREEDEMEEDETVGRQTPINHNSTRLPASPPLCPSQLIPQQQLQFANPRQELLTAQLQTHTHGLGGNNCGFSEESHLENYQHSFRQCHRQYSPMPMGSFPQQRQQVQRQSLQITGSSLTGEDPETGKPLDQAIADCVRKYATFSVTELHAELNSVKESKKTLQKFLKDFEHDFERKNGRKVEAEDRQPLNPEYMHYKMLKARLASLERLIEARSKRISH